MNTQLPPLQIRVYELDGRTRVFAQHDSALANEAIMKLNPAKLFADRTIKIIEDDSEFVFGASRLTRVDLMTDRLSVWDFPFVLGAHVELTAGEFRECLRSPQPPASPNWRNDLPVFVTIAMANSQRYFFWMEVAGGLSALRMNRIHATLQEGRLIFGLRTGGIGVLNLAHLAYFSMYPEPPLAMAEAQSAGYKVERNDFGLAQFPYGRTEDGEPRTIRPAHDRVEFDSHFTSDPVSRQ